jgi:hypothetical protein
MDGNIHTSTVHRSPEWRHHQPLRPTKSTHCRRRNAKPAYRDSKRNVERRWRAESMSFEFIQPFRLNCQENAIANAADGATSDFFS